MELFLFMVVSSFKWIRRNQKQTRRNSRPNLLNQAQKNQTIIQVQAKTQTKKEESFQDRQQGHP